MNSLFTKMGALVLALALCFAAVSLANAETEYPPRPERSSADLAVCWAKRPWKIWKP